MADVSPLKAVYNPDDTVKSLAEFTVSDVVGVEDGGTGVGQLGNIVSSNPVFTITGGEGVVINNVIVGFDSSALALTASTLTGIIDGGTFT